MHTFPFFKPKSITGVKKAKSKIIARIPSSLSFLDERPLYNQLKTDMGKFFECFSIWSFVTIHA